MALTDSANLVAHTRARVSPSPAWSASSTEPPASRALASPARALASPAYAPASPTCAPASRPHAPAPAQAAGSAVELSLRCVWSSHPTHDRSCRTRVPIRVVAQAWKRELARGRAHEGFFHFSWEDEVWLAYGLANGRVRGVYCPEHAAERDEHTFAPV